MTPLLAPPRSAGQLSPAVTRVAGYFRLFVCRWRARHMMKKWRPPDMRGETADGAYSDASEESEAARHAGCWRVSPTGV